MPELLLLLLILVVIGVALGVDFTFYIVYVLAGVYLVARWWAGRSLPKLQVRRRAPSHIFLGEVAQVTLEITNTSWWPVPWLWIEEAPPLQLATGQRIRQVVSLRPKEQLQLAYELVGRRRGYYQVGPASFSAGDVFGFADIQARVEAVDHLTVYPRVIPLMQVDLTSRSPHGVIKSHQHIYSDPARVIGKRDYMRGDPPRSIDWKSSARSGTLQVKKYEPAVSLTTMLFLDLRTAAYSRQLRYSASEWAIVVAASLANYLVDQRQAVGVASNGLDPLTGATQWRIPPRPGRLHLMRLLEWLARVELADALPLAEWLPLATTDLAWGATVIAITPTGDELICSALHRLLRAGLNPVLVVVEPHGQFGVIRERARRLGVAAHMVASEHELDRWRTVAYRKSVAR